MPYPLPSPLLPSPVPQSPTLPLSAAITCACCSNCNCNSLHAGIVRACRQFTRSLAWARPFLDHFPFLSSPTTTTYNHSSQPMTTQTTQSSPPATTSQRPRKTYLHDSYMSPARVPVFYERGIRLLFLTIHSSFLTGHPLRSTHGHVARLPIPRPSRSSSTCDSNLASPRFSSP